MGALALVLCLALPAGLLSLLADGTTGEQVDAADLILTGRISSLQVLDDPTRTFVEIDAQDVILGSYHARSVNLKVEGRPPLEVGDTVLAMIARARMELLGVYQTEKNPGTLEVEVISPVDGMMAQGISGAGPHDPVPLALLEAAIRTRRGLPASAGHQAGGGTIAATSGGGPGPDPYEPNGTLLTASHISGLHPPTLVTGNPLILSGMSLRPNDVDFFIFETPGSVLLHAATLSGLSMFPPPDTLIGLFNGHTRRLLAWDDDSGPGRLSYIIAPIDKPGYYAVAVESSPDTDLDFTGDEGTSTGEYRLSLELQTAAFMSNLVDRTVGVSPDGTFIEDQIGFKAVDGEDILLAGVPADGWAVNYDVIGLPEGDRHVYGGAGEQLSAPGFTDTLIPLSFELGGLTTPAGTNPRGHSRAETMVSYTGIDEDPRGVMASFDYTLGYGDRTVVGDIMLQAATVQPIQDLEFSRVMDIDLFGSGPDQFFWSFRPKDRVQAFAVDVDSHVGDLQAPDDMFGNSKGDLQMALLIKHGDMTGSSTGEVAQYRTAFTLATGFPTRKAALNEAVARLRAVGVETWVAAVDRDPVNHRRWTDPASGSGPACQRMRLPAHYAHG
jgi:hypothetical protein